MNLRDVAGASQMYVAVSSSIAPDISTEAFKQYRRTLLEQAGSPTDPIEVMLIEQIALAHFHIGRLHLRSCSTSDGLLSVAFADAATRLTAEFRRSALALEDYRAKQIARAQSATATAVKAVVAELDAKPKRPAKKKLVGNKLPSSPIEEMPQWVRKRMSPTRDESGLAASIN